MGLCTKNILYIGNQDEIDITNNASIQLIIYNIESINNKAIHKLVNENKIDTIIGKKKYLK